MKEFQKEMDDLNDRVEELMKNIPDFDEKFSYDFNDPAVKFRIDTAKFRKGLAVISPDKIGNYKMSAEQMEKLRKLAEEIRMDTARLNKLRNLRLDTARISKLRNLRVDTTAFSRNRGTRVFHNGKEIYQETPTRTENKTFPNITKVNFVHQYGNIVVKESNSKQVELEIKYIDVNGKKGIANVSSSGGVLAISSSNTALGSARINFVISIPKNTALNIDLTYGNIRMDDYHGVFSSNLTYSNLKANSFVNTKPVFKGRYGNVKIDNVKDIVVDASYTNVNINDVNKMELSGDYNNYNITNVKDIVADKYMSGNFKIGSIANISGDMKYVNLTINNLTSSISTNCDYSNIKIYNISPQLNADIKGRYSDIILNIPNDVSASFNVILNHGKFNVDKKFTVKYTEQNDGPRQVIKKGQIGTKKPTAVINISNSFADVKFK